MYSLSLVNIYDLLLTYEAACDVTNLEEIFLFCDEEPISPRPFDKKLF